MKTTHRRDMRILLGGPPFGVDRWLHVTGARQEALRRLIGAAENDIEICLLEAELALLGHIMDWLLEARRAA